MERLGPKRRLRLGTRKVQTLLHPLCRGWCLSDCISQPLGTICYLPVDYRKKSLLWVEGKVFGFSIVYLNWGLWTQGLSHGQTIMRSTACNSAFLPFHLWKIQPRSVCKGSFAMSPRDTDFLVASCAKQWLENVVGNAPCTHMYLCWTLQANDFCFINLLCDPFQMCSFWGPQFSHLQNDKGQGWCRGNMMSPAVLTCGIPE